MPVNLTGKLFNLTILLIILAEILSLFVYLAPAFSQAAFFIILAAVLILALIKLEYGLYVLLAELFIGGLGYLFAFNLRGTTLSIRLGLFLIILSVWLFSIIKDYLTKKTAINDLKKNISQAYFLLPYSLLVFYLIYGVINGLRHNQPANVFFDINAWFYLALIFVYLKVVNNRQTLENILQILTAAAGYLALKTIAVLFLFSHNYAGIGGFFYKWLRTTGVGEITYINGTLFRVFFQSQLYCLFAALLILCFLITKKINDKNAKILTTVIFYLTSLAIVISQSRSFWLGGLAGLAALIIIVIWQFNFRIKKTALLILALSAIFVSQLFFVQLITNNFSGNLLKDRFGNLQTDAASQSRVSQLKPLADNIFKKPFFGYGFGKTLAYQSRDPRVLQNNPGGLYTTYAFEWGYWDIVLKIGFIGLLIYLALMFQILLDLLRSKNQSLKVASLGLFIGLIALGITNIFSPYLNHPLGISYLLLLIATTQIKS